MDALEALAESRGWHEAWTALIRARPPKTREENQALVAEFHAAAHVLMCWDEASEVIATVLSLRDAEAQRIRVSEASAVAWKSYGDVGADGVLYNDKGQPFDLAASRAHAATAVQSAATKALQVEDRLRDSVAKRRDALANRLYDINELKRRGRAAVEEEIAIRAARVGDLATLRPLLIAMIERGTSPTSALPLAVDELAEAKARAARVAQVRESALTVGDKLAADREHAAALAEVRAIERRDQGDGEDALAAGLRHAEALQAADRLPG